MTSSESESESETRPFLIVTGSSAGGIDALLSFVASLPPDLPAPIVIAQHIAPTHESRLEKIFEGRTKLRVTTVESEATLAPATIYLIGPDRDAEIEDEHVRVSIASRGGSKPSVDLLFSSAARAFGERAIAIVFSGLGHDGLAGARAIKDYGGTLIVQEATSAAFPSMPLAIPPTLIDFTARPEAMGDYLIRLLSGSAAPREAADHDRLRVLLAQVRERSDIDFSQYKMPTIVRRLSRLMVAAGVESVDEYLHYLARHPDEYQRLTNSFLIKVTEFFRDTALFDHLRSRVLPRLIEEARLNGNEIRVWSAGTSTGEEAYSLAILFAEHLRDDIDGLTVRIFATDLDENAVAFARRGIFSADSLKHVPRAWVERYFISFGDAYEVGKLIRNMTVFGLHDLAQRAPFPRIDLCFCRNVLIYFTKELQTRALQLFAFSLRRHGVLVLGKAEAIGAMTPYFDVIEPALKIYERIGERILLPPTRFNEAASLEDRSSNESQLPPGALPSFARSYASRASSETFGPLIAAAPVGVVVVDRRYDIVAINAAARTLLEIHGIGVGEDLIHLIRTLEGSDLRARIDAAFRSEESLPFELPVREIGGDVERWLRVAVAHDGHGRGETVGIFVIDVTDNVARRIELERVAADMERRLAELGSRGDEMTLRQRRLVQANDELIAANADLRSLNEQLLISAEEAASSNEEIETLNEEMQATNEELETLNEELQATVEELNTTNDELEARGRDLEESATSSAIRIAHVESERDALARALETVAGPYVVVALDGTISSASALLGDPADVRRLPPGWWKSGTVTLGGKTYRTNVPAEDDGSFSVVVLQEL